MSEPLEIVVLDPSPESLRLAKERFEEMATIGGAHSVEYSQKIKTNGTPTDLAIIATTSRDRLRAIEEAYAAGPVNCFVLEKILFQQPEDFEAARKLFLKNGSRVWVNCITRFIPAYRNIKSSFTHPDLFYHVSGGIVGLATSTVHFLDHIAYLTGCFEYTVDTSLLDPVPIKSKREGFLEFNGTLTARFSNGTLFTITHYPAGIEPTQIIIGNRDARYIFRQEEEKVWVAKASDGWRSEEKTAPFLYQSIMTTTVVEDILGKGSCDLSTYEESVKVHLPLMEALRAFLNTHGSEQYDYYPFT